MTTLNAFQPEMIPGARPGWLIEHANFRITDVQIGGIWHEFEQDECGTSLCRDTISRDIHFHHDGMSDEELAYFTVSLYETTGQLVMVPGNSQIQSIKVSEVSLTQSEACQ